MTEDEITSETARKVQVRHELFKTIRGLLISLVIGVLLATVLIETVVIVRINERGQGSRDLLEKIDNSNSILIDCTTPGHKCYDDGQKATSDAVGQINRIIILASFCAQDNHTLVDIQLCVTDNLQH
jgi:hypothetical protein